AFYVDIPETTMYLDISSGSGMIGGLFDDHATPIDTWTQVTGSTTWQNYTGWIGFPAPGRHYFVPYNPAAPQVVINASYSVAQLPAIGESTPTGPIDLSPTFDQTLFYYDSLTTDPWQTFAISGTETGGEKIQLYDTTTAIGRFDALVTSAGPIN